MAETRTPGQRIARLRETYGMTREALAERSGLDASVLARIEDEGLVPDLAPLVKIARALGTRLGTFMDDQEELGPVVCRAGEARSSVRCSGAARSGELDFMALAAGKGGRHMEPFLIDLTPGPTEAPESTHEGEEFLYVLEGGIEVAYGAERYAVGKGDSIYYDSIVPHRVSAAGGKPARILAVVHAPF